MKNNNNLQKYLKIEKLQKYLLETSINKEKQSVTTNINSNVLGAVLAFNTNIKCNETFKTFNSLSLLVFLDLRTGRVERYLINSSDPKANDKGIDYKEDLYFTWENNKYRVFHDFEHSALDTTNLSEIGDGKLNIKFYSIFMAELLRDYLHYFISFKNSNIATLRKLTAPIKSPTYDYSKIEDNKTFSIQENNPKIKSGLGTGRISELEKNLINESYDYKLKDFEPFYAHKFIKNSDSPTSKNKWIIFVPKQLNNKMIENWFNHFNFNLIYVNRNELPQLTKDFSRTLSIKTIPNIDNINTRIKTFNYNIVKNLQNLEENESKKKKENKKFID